MTEASEDLVVGFLYDDSLDSNDGVAHQVKTIGDWLTKQGHKVVYLVGETKMTSWNGGKVYSLAKNQTVIFNGNKLSIPWPAPIKRVNEVIKNEPIDVVHVQVPYSPFMSMRVINRLNPATAVIGTFHIFPSGFLSRWGTFFLKYLYGRSLRRFDKFTSVSQAAHDFAKWSLKIDSSVIPNVIDPTKLVSNLAPVKKDHQTIVFLGRLVPRKGANLLLKAFLGLHQSMPEVRLIIAGDGSERSMLEKFVKQNGLTNVVNFAGYVDEAKKAELLSGANIACFPSISGESFGIVLVEAMAAGAGVVLGGDNPGYRTVLGNQPKMLVDPNNTDDLTSRLAELLTDKKLAEQLREWQNDQVKNYDINVVGPKLVAMYRSVIANTNSKRHN